MRIPLFLWVVFTILSKSLDSQLPLAFKFNLVPPQEKIGLIVNAPSSQFVKFLNDFPSLQLGAHRGDFFSIYTPHGLLNHIYNQRWIKQIQVCNTPAHPFLDSSRILNNVDSVHLGISPLIKKYTGKNVIVGIVDFGIEWRHSDFKNNLGETRIIALWDQNKDSIPPTPYAYGHKWSSQDINSNVCTHNASSSYGHGTNVAGIAAGNGNILPQYRGIAPEANILAVSLKNDNNWLNHIVDGIDYIFRVSDSLNIPCVINLSVGAYDGSHDGRDPSTRMIESYLNRKSRAIVAAAGNAGHIAQHIRFNPNQDTLFTDFTFNPSYNGIYFNFWADTQQTKNLNIGIQADSPVTLLPISLPYHFNFKSQFLDSLAQYGYYEDSIEVENLLGAKVGKAYFYLLKQENTVNFQCYIQPTNPNLLWRFSASGNGTLDMWVNNALQVTSNVYTGLLPTKAVNPLIDYYKLPDIASSITSGFQCSDKIITVGNYVNKFGIIDIDSIYRPIGGKQNEIASNSSRGPTRDGRLKPNIAASGGQTIAPIDSITSANFALSTTNRRKLGKTGSYSVGGGTSMSAPVVSGCIALLFEKYPHLDYNQIQYLLHKTAKRDSFTGSSVNNTYGNGKIDAFRLLSYPIVYGCRDTGSINYNPNADFEDSLLCIKKKYGCTDTGSINYDIQANIDDGSCIKKIYGIMDTSCFNYSPTANIASGNCITKVYGCMDSLASNYNPHANISDNSCTYASSNLSNSHHGIKIYPNPLKDWLTLEGLRHTTYLAKLINSEGKIIYQENIKSGERIHIGHLHRGLYTFIIVSDSEVYKNKLLLE